MSADSIEAQPSHGCDLERAIVKSGVCRVDQAGRFKGVSLPKALSAKTGPAQTDPVPLRSLRLGHASVEKVFCDR